MLTLADIKAKAKERVDYIVHKEQSLGKQITGAEQELLTQILSSFAETIVNKNGITDTQTSNVAVMKALDQIVDKFMVTQNMQVMRSYVGGLNQLNTLNADYYNTVSANRAKSYTDQANNFMAKQIGLDGNNLVSGGFLDTFVKDTSLKNDLKQFTYNAITGGMKYSDFIAGLKSKVVTTTDGPGILQRHYQTFAYDTMSEYDRAIGLQYKNKLGFKTAVYAGGLIDDSREFCIKKNDKVFTEEEMNTWKDDPTLPKSKKEKESGTLQNYNPKVNLGRWRCRHTLNWISEELALQLRPDLKDYFAKAKPLPKEEPKPQPKPEPVPKPKPAKVVPPKEPVAPLKKDEVKMESVLKDIKPNNVIDIPIPKVLNQIYKLNKKTEPGASEYTDNKYKALQSWNNEESELLKNTYVMDPGQTPLIKYNIGDTVNLQAQMKSTGNTKQQQFEAWHQNQSGYYNSIDGTKTYTIFKNGDLKLKSNYLDNMVANGDEATIKALTKMTKQQALQDAKFIKPAEEPQPGSHFDEDVFGKAISKFDITGTSLTDGHSEAWSIIDQNYSGTGYPVKMITFNKDLADQAKKEGKLVYSVAVKDSDINTHVIQSGKLDVANLAKQLAGVETNFVSTTKTYGNKSTYVLIPTKDGLTKSKLDFWTQKAMEDEEFYNQVVGLVKPSVPIELPKPKVTKVVKKKGKDPKAGNVEVGSYQNDKDVSIIKKAGASLTDDERRQISYYTGSWYSVVNEYLGKGLNNNKDMNIAVEKMVSAMNKLPNYKSVSVRAEGYYKGSNTFDYYKQMRDLNVGDTFVKKAFTSTSEKARFLKSWKSSYDYQIHYHVSGKTGAPIKFLSNYGDEEEILFRPGTRFRITKKVLEKKTSGEVLTVYVEEF